MKGGQDMETKCHKEFRHCTECRVIMVVAVMLMLVLGHVSSFLWNKSLKLLHKILYSIYCIIETKKIRIADV